MKNILLTIVILILSIGVNAQIQFEQILPPPPAPQLITNFDGVRNSSICFSDIDGDSDQDVLIAGWNSLGFVANLYSNDGYGNFSLVSGVPFDGVRHGSVAFSDVDGDNDQDIIITGENSSYQPIAKLYINDGLANFSLVSGTPFEGVKKGSVVFSDVDGDNDQDVIITGENSSSQPIAKLYINDGLANFSLVSGTPFEGVKKGSVVFSDVDGDNDQDVIITGENSSSQPTAKLYVNDGLANFSLVSGMPFEGVKKCSIAISDIDGDNDQDVIITGENSSSQPTAKLYVNDGLANFSLVSGTPFEGVRNSSVSFSDIDGDNDPDVLITGYSSSNQIIAKLYTNDGTGVFNTTLGVQFDGVQHGSIAFSDVDNDNDNDVLITGRNGYNQSFAKLYINDGSGNFSLASGSLLDGVEYGAIAFSDIDGDNDQDVLITGWNTNEIESAKLYVNDGTGTYSLVGGTPFDGVQFGSVAFSDIDGDGDQDVLITGQSNYGQFIAKLYTNDGFGIYSLVSGTPFEGVWFSSVAFSDVDGDNDQDVLIIGNNSSNQKTAKLYINDGSGNFSLPTANPFVGFSSGSIAFSDVDGDNDQDVIFTGAVNSGAGRGLFKNDGAGNFVYVPFLAFDGVSSSSMALFDMDGDNDDDALITGINHNGQIIAKLYTNDGTGNFTVVNGTPFEGVYRSSVSIADVDGDNDLDILIAGRNSSNQPTTKLYTNDGGGNFSLVSGMSFEDVYSSGVAFSDVDGDNDPDVLITGITSSGERIAKLFRNINCFPSSSTDAQSACGSYTWIDGNTYSSSNNSAMHTLTNVTGCDSVVTLNLTINTVDNSITTADPSVTANAVGATYNWLDCSNTYALITGEVNQVFTATVNGDYAVEVTENGCTDTSSCVTISAVGINNANEAGLVKLYPNPSNEVINIDLGSLKDVAISVYNTQGKLVYSVAKVLTEVYQFELNVENGVYFIEVVSNEEKYHLKLIKE